MGIDRYSRGRLEHGVGMKRRQPQKGGSGSREKGDDTGARNISPSEYPYPSFTNAATARRRSDER
eukprot:945666-Pleurochrysis_carterae.AAC.1